LAGQVSRKSIFIQYGHMAQVIPKHRKDNIVFILLIVVIIILHAARL
jgi:hypothetical protein